MDVEFSAGEVCCRVTREELGKLLSGRAVTLDVALPREHRFRMNVRPAALNGWQLESDPTGLWLSIPRGDLEALEKTLATASSLDRALETSGSAPLHVRFEVET